MWPLPVVLCIVSCLFLSKANHSLYRFPPRFGSILGAYWYTNVGNACSFLFGTIRGSFCSQRWYIIWLKKWATFRLPVDSLVYSEIICLFPWTLSESCRHIYDLKFCVPLLDICCDKDRHHNGKDCHTKACTEQTLQILCSQYSHKNYSDRNGYCKKNL